MLVILFACFAVGVCLGAIINLCIYRLAYLRRRISPWCFTRGLVPQRCWADRIPIVGWISLRREAEHHGRGFWIRPLLIELGFGLLVAGLYWWEIDRRALITPPLQPWAPPLGTFADAMMHSQFAVHVVLLVFMAIATFIDIDEQTVPDAVTVPGTIIGLLIAAVCQASTVPALEVLANPNRWEDLLWPLRFDFPEQANAFLPSANSLVLGLSIYLLWCFALLPRHWRTGVGVRKAWRVMWRRIAGRSDWTWIMALAVAGSVVIVPTWLRGGPAWRGLFSGLVGLAIGGGMIWIIRIIGAVVLKREAMGFGDVTLMAMIGAFYGWQPVILVFFLAPFAGAILGLLQYLLHRDNVVPYGPFLCLAALVVLIFWAPIWNYAGQMFEIPWLVPSAIAVCLPLLALLLFAWKLLKDRLIGNDE
jgi:prepilin signal peptidase PulO-like enzyme (type II secretory pathway)